ncbi:MAG: AraC family transcriptional regulator [Kiritimatiellae bacterium]|jgi:AraC-like DNA-binding protein|nr:AraC family transcriptional regulator [Kiritimatiellia bacterium]
MPQNEKTGYARYLPIETDALLWGLHVVDCGYTEIAPGSEYPPGKERHPSNYMFSWENGRTLNEYQLVYITEGSGVFESEPTGRVKIEAGNIFLLYPGIWHRYQPTRETGWHESWIGFNGDYAQRIMTNFFPPEKAVISTGYNEKLITHIRSTTDLMRQAPLGYQQLLAARTIDILARIRSLSLSSSPINRKNADKVQQARCYLLEHFNEEIDLDALAKDLGASYSSFRRMFKAHTGAAPLQYQIDIRINRACELLTNTTLNMSEISEMLGFSTAYYFSRLFKKREGCAPFQYRKNHQAK